MIEKAYFNGESIESDCLDKVLLEKGLTVEKIEHIRDGAYRNWCCDPLEDSDCFRPVIDFGTSEVLGMDVTLPYLDSNGKVEYRRTFIGYCPFCGKPFKKKIHPESQKLLEDY